MVVDIADVVNYTNFGDHRLRGFRGQGGQISPFSIDFHRRPYNTLALTVRVCDSASTMTTRAMRPTFKGGSQRRTNPTESEFTIRHEMLI